MICPNCNRESNVTVVYIGRDKPSVCGRCAADEKKAEVSKLRVVRRERVPLRVGMTTLVGTITMHKFSGPCEKCGHDHSGRNGHYRGSVSSGFVCCEKKCGGRIPIVDPFPLDHGNCCSLTHPYVDRKPTGPSYRCRNMNSENVGEAAKRWPELVTGVECEILEDESCRVVDERLPANWRKHYCAGCGYFENDEYERRLNAAPDRPAGPSRKLNMTWSGESDLDAGIIYAPYIPTDSDGKPLQ